VGVKVRSFLRFHDIEPAWYIPQFERQVDLRTVDALADELMERFTAKSLRTVEVAHATYVSTSVQRPQLLTLLPLGELTRVPTSQQLGGSRPLGPGEYDYMPTPDEILSELLPRSVSLRLYQTFLDSILSEQVARMTSMHLANENGGEMVRMLTMEYNRARQATITTELAEIVTGVDAMK
jgi:F-type H+-transporting ATPase subunit gamma